MTQSATLINKDNINDVLQGLKTNTYKFYQFYNIDIDIDEYSFIRHMTQFKDSNSSKLLNKSYYDIEVLIDPAIFPDPKKADYMVNAIALYNNISNTAYILTIVHDCNITNPLVLQEEVNKLYQVKCEENDAYVVENIEINVLVQENEEELIQTFFKLVQEQNNLMLIGFNSATFDDPYMFNRTHKLFGENSWQSIISEFGEVQKYGESSFELPDYILVDILKLYKPVGSGGGGLGKSLPDFKLNTICKKELGITKLDLDEDFNDVYYNDIVTFLTYNLLDTLLVYKLDLKLGFMELMFDLSKYNKATMGSTINGRSILYKYRNDLMYSSQDKIIRTNKFSKEVLFEPKIKENL